MGIPDDYVSGAIQPFLVTGNDFTNKNSGITKLSMTSFFNNYLLFLRSGKQPKMSELVFNYKVLGIGDSKGPGWNGADGNATFTLPNGDVLMTFGDGFYTTTMSKCFLQTLRNPDNLDMISNSVLYLKLSKDKKKIDNGIYFMGQYSPEITTCKYTDRINFWDSSKKQYPFDFNPIGCADLFSVDPEKTFNYSQLKNKDSLEKSRYWLMGGASGKNSVFYVFALLVAKKIMKEPKIVEFHLMKITEAFNKTDLLINPFLWQQHSEIKYFSNDLGKYVTSDTGGFYSDVRYTRMFDLNEG